ncbi:unnamed protein product [Blepharisma stoltei]|uniref:Uncharacterized protein n=1 Tax=Blepharisma stoltei TaxID=1481888 RepID=A0AAU9JQV1_9CILI|nr:unnamed protein product [Blepharisma stoltei]
MESGTPLREIVRILERSWKEEYKKEAKKGLADAKIIYAKILIKGAAHIRKNPKLAIKILKEISFKSPEASLMLAKLYLKGKSAAKDLYKAYYYLRITVGFDCKCEDRYKAQLHSGEISNVFSCNYALALRLLNMCRFPDDCEERFRVKFEKHIQKLKPTK